MIPRKFNFEVFQHVCASLLSLVFARLRIGCMTCWTLKCLDSEEVRNGLVTGPHVAKRGAES